MVKKRISLAWRRFKVRRDKERIPSGVNCLWRRDHDGYVFMGWHNYRDVFIAGGMRLICSLDESRWCVVPGDDIPILD